MQKLYKRVGGRILYHEAWANDDVVTEHWGLVGEQGDTREHRVESSHDASTAISSVLVTARDNGYEEVDLDDHDIMAVEFDVDGFGTPHDLEKRHRLEDRMNETLGWTGLGHCDGGSIGSGTMEVACFVVDYETARCVVENDFEGTEFANYTRIYNERA